MDLCETDLQSEFLDMQGYTKPAKRKKEKKKKKKKKERKNKWNISFFFFFLVLVFQDRISLCSPGCPGTHSVDQAGLELRNTPLPG
jgi:hypothetical protein